MGWCINVRQPRPSLSDEEMVERETGPMARSTKPSVKFMYRIGDRYDPKVD
jgi:hypothetical protein